MNYASLDSGSLATGVAKMSPIQSRIALMQSCLDRLSDAIDRVAQKTEMVRSERPCDPENNRKEEITPSCPMEILMADACRRIDYSSSLLLRIADEIQL